VSRVLKLPAYRRLLAAYTLNELAWGVGSVALALLVFRRTGSAVGAMGFFLCAQFVPALVSPLLVARLDQRSARHVLPALYLLEGAAYLGLGVLASRFVLVPVLALTIANGIVALTARSLARAATVSVLTPAGLLREGNALSNGAFSVCFMTGPAIGGLAVGAGRTATALFTLVGVFAVIAVTLATAGALPAAPEQPVPAAGRLRAALAHTRAHPAIRTLLSLQAAALTFFTMSIPVEVVFAQRTLHAGPRGYGVLLSAWGAGAVAGSAIYARWRALSARTLIAFGAAALGIGFAIMAAAPSLGLAVAGSAVAGVGNGVEAVSARTALQEQVEESWMALTMSFNESLGAVVPGVGIVLGGGIAALAGPRAALATAGIGALGIAAFAVAALRGPSRISPPLASSDG
jgi:MFS family permease